MIQFLCFWGTYLTWPLLALFYPGKLFEELSYLTETSFIIAATVYYPSPYVFIYLKGSDEEIATLKNDLENVTSEHDHEMRELKELIFRTLDQSSHEKEKMLSGMIRQFEVEKMEMKNFHVAQETALQCVIDQITKELHGRRETTETLNKDLDRIKLNYDNLLVEKNLADSNFEALVAEMSSKDNQMNEMDRRLHQQRMENFGLLSGSESLQIFVVELRLRVEELEEEVSKHRVVILDRSEEKCEGLAARLLGSSASRWSTIGMNAKNYVEHLAETSIVH